VAGHGYADSAGTYQYDRVAEKEGVYVVNDSNQVLPAFGVMMAWRLAKATDPTGRNETDVFRINIDGQDTDNPYSITDSLCLLVNGPSDLANERVGIAYPINDYFPRPALYDTDQTSLKMHMLCIQLGFQPMGLVAQRTRFLCRQDLMIR
jgi:hypothetical protein